MNLHLERRRAGLNEGREHKVLVVLASGDALVLPNHFLKLGQLLRQGDLGIELHVRELVGKRKLPLGAGGSSAKCCIARHIAFSAPGPCPPGPRSW